MINIFSRRYLFALIFFSTILSLHGRESDVIFQNPDSSYIEKLNEQAFRLAPSNFEKALDYARKSLYLSDSLDIEQLKAKAYNRLGVIYYYNSGYDQALENYFKGLKINEDIKNKTGIARDLNNIGLVYAELQNYDNALKYYLKSLSINRSIKYQKGIANNYNNIGIVYRHKANYDSALFYYNKAIELNRKRNDSTLLAYNYNNVGNLQRDQEKYSEAYASFNRALRLNQKLGNKTELARNYINLGDMLVHQKKYKDAEKLLERGIAQNREIGSKELIADYLDSKIELKKAQGKTEELPNLYDQYIAINDSIYSSELDQERQKLAVLYELTKKEDQIKLLEAQNKTQTAKMQNAKIFRRSLIIISALLLVILTLLFNRYKLKSRMNKNLEKLVNNRTADLKKAKEKAEESDRLKSAFLSNMSHEIRTPMNAIAGFTELLTESEPEISQKEKRELLMHINQNSDTLLRLIDDILDIAKIQADQIEINKTAFNPYDVIQEIYKNYTNLNKEKNLEFNIETPEHGKNLMLFTDPHRISQVLHNLTDNAFKFTEKGSVTLGFKLNDQPDKKEITFFVKDTGIGISETQQKIIFKRFGKAEEHKEKLFRGAGLGLSISKHIIELLNGELGFESELNKGSHFYFTLPCS